MLKGRIMFNAKSAIELIEKLTPLKITDHIPIAESDIIKQEISNRFNPNL